MIVDQGFGRFGNDYANSVLVTGAHPMQSDVHCAKMYAHIISFDKYTYMLST